MSINFSQNMQVNKSVYLYYMKSIGLFFTFCTFTMLALFQFLRIFSCFWLVEWTTSTTLPQKNTHDQYYYLLGFTLISVGQSNSRNLKIYFRFCNMIFSIHLSAHSCNHFIWKFRFDIDTYFNFYEFIITILWLTYCSQ